jgi:hypothetical protein
VKPSDLQGTSSERRKHARFPMRGIAFGVLKTKSGVEELGQIIDIGRGGLALRHFVGCKHFSDARSLDIMVSSTQFYIENIRVRSVSMMGVKSHLPFPRVAMCRLGVSFEHLTHRQKEQLDYLIKAYAGSKSAQGPPP